MITRYLQSTGCPGETSTLTAHESFNLAAEVRSILLHGPTTGDSAEAIREVMHFALHSQAIYESLCEQAARALCQQAVSVVVGFQTEPCVHRDPELGFVITTSTEPVGVDRTPHDHGDCWGVYCTLAGRGRVLRYVRVDEGRALDELRLTKLGEFEVEARSIDVVGMGGIHETLVLNTHVSLVVRCHDLRRVTQGYYDLKHGTYIRLDRSANKVVESGIVHLQT